MTKVFGWTMDEYADAVLKEMSRDYGWYTAEMFTDTDGFTIGKIRELVDGRSARDRKDPRREKPLRNPKETVAAVCSDIKQHIEWSPERYLEWTGGYSVPFLPEEHGGWTLEDYRFDRYGEGVYFATVTAGDRSAGASRTFYIPRRIIDGHTYEEFLDLYFKEIADPFVFGLGKDVLGADGTLKAFLGFTERRAHPEASEEDLPEMTLYCVEGYCRGDGMEHIKENRGDGDRDLAGGVWRRFRELLPGKEHLAVLDADGNVPCFWGIMTGDNVFSDDSRFSTAWTHYYRTGFYLAAFETVPDAPDTGIGGDWLKRVLPARHYVTADVTGASPDVYDVTFNDYVNRIMPEMGYMLSGAVVERIDPRTGSEQLLFPVERI